MGLFDLFKGGGGKGKEKGSSPASKYADVAANKRAQGYERQEAIGKLCDMGTVDAAEALLRRFTFASDPSITDQEEKEMAFRGIVSVGKEALEPVRAFVAKAERTGESISWPIRIVKELVDEDAYVQELIKWLEPWHTEYKKSIDPKLQILTALEDHKHPTIRPAVERFLDDVNEPSRFAAVAVTFAQDDEAAAGVLAKALVNEESFRIKNKIVDGFAARGWAVPEDQRDAVRAALPMEAAMDSNGKLRRG